MKEIEIIVTNGRIATVTACNLSGFMTNGVEDLSLTTADLRTLCEDVAEAVKDGNGRVRLRVKA